jgi:hypothetical protein
MTPRRAHGEDGVTLAIALAFLMFFSLLIPALVILGATNLLATSRLQVQRGVVYAADGATDGAIQYLRSHPSCGRPLQTVSTCPISTGSTTATFQATMNNQTSIATITATGGVFELDRTVTLETTVDGVTRVRATAIIRDSSTAAEPPVDVKTWAYVR